MRHFTLAGMTVPSVALIIDDLGYDKKIAQKFAQLDVTLTFSILPHSPFQQKIAKLARSKGLEIMIHMPMEPVEYPKVNPGPGVQIQTDVYIKGHDIVWENKLSVSIGKNCNMERGPHIRNNKMNGEGD